VGGATTVAKQRRVEAWRQVIERGYEGGEGQGQRVRGRGDEALAEGQAEGLDGRGGSLVVADQRGAVAEPLRRIALCVTIEAHHEAAHALGVDISL
jgi:hypothetical protein